MAVNDTLEISQNILDALKADPVLSAYVKSFETGGADISRKIFPFIAVATSAVDIDPLSMGRKGFVRQYYTTRISAGVKHSIPETAHAGDDLGNKGIIQLMGDILNAAYPCDFNGTFELPADLITADTAHKSGSGGRTWIGLAIIRGWRKENRNIL